MADDQKYLRQRRGRWLVQIAVPKDLQERLGKRNVEKSLRTSSLSEAKRCKHAVVAKIFEEFDRLRQSKPQADTVIEALPHVGNFNRGSTPAETRVLSDSLIQTVAQEEMRYWYDILSKETLAGHQKLDDWVSSVENNPDRYEILMPRAWEYVHRIGVQPTSDSLLRLCDALLEAPTRAQEHWLNGSALPATSPGVLQAPEELIPTISEAAKRYLDERTRDPKARPTNQTVAQMEVAFRLFTDHMNNCRLDEVAREDAAAFLEALSRLDRHYGRSPSAKGMPLKELLAKYPASEGNGLSNTTLNRHCSALQGLYKWARRRGLYDGENPFAEQSRITAPQSKAGWLPYTSDELRNLIETPQIRPNKPTWASARPWVVLIALYSGMRQGEICELAVENIKKQDGIHYFDITEAKSEAGVRRVPIHSELIRIGFLDYVKFIGSGELFPGVTRGGPDRKRAHTFAKRFAPWRRERGVDRDRVTFHSFRKCAVRALENAQVDRSLAAQVIGHERGFTYSVYNPEGVNMNLLRDVVEKITYEGL